MNARKTEKSSGTDWERIDRLTDDEIERLAAADPDNPSTTREDWLDAVLVASPAKVVVNAKFDADVVDWFKAGGRGYQTRMNAVLRRYMDAHKNTR